MPSSAPLPTRHMHTYRHTGKDQSGRPAVVSVTTKSSRRGKVRPIRQGSRSQSTPTRTQRRAPSLRRPSSSPHSSCRTLDSLISWIAPTDPGLELVDLPVTLSLHRPIFPPPRLQCIVRRVIPGDCSSLSRRRWPRGRAMFVYRQRAGSCCLTW